MVKGSDNDLPLTESTYLVLLSLTTPMHGYAVMQNVERISEGRVSVGPGTLYGALKTMLHKQWICELPGDEPRRKRYALTQEGKNILKFEIGRLGQLARLGERITWEGED